MSIEPPPPGPGTTAFTPDDLHAWQILRPLLDAGGYLPWSSGAMRPLGLVELCNEIVLGPRRRIIELGSGSSTILLARLLRTRGGRLDAIEHDPEWAAWVRSQLEAEELTPWTTITHAPLQPAVDHGTRPWYAVSTVAAVSSGPPIDLLIVDGPPAYKPGDARSRLPALPVLIDRLAPGAVVVLDDIARAGEQAVLTAWETQTPFRFDRRDSGIAIGRVP
jgi:hypothetical protein